MDWYVRRQHASSGLFALIQACFGAQYSCLPDQENDPDAASRHFHVRVCDFPERSILSDINRWTMNQRVLSRTFWSLSIACGSFCTGITRGSSGTIKNITGMRDVKENN